MRQYKPYLDIPKIKADITMAHILSYYGIGLRQINDYRLTGCCPIHKGDNANAFHVDLKRNIFNCFTHCGGGSIFDFVMKKEGLPLGYCRHGIMKNRIAIPIIDSHNRIVAYCGRAVQDNITPKYLFPKNFKKSHHLFNIQSVTPGGQPPVFVVEGFFDCIHIVKAGLTAIALMGNTVSSQQLTMMKRVARFYTLMLDGDEAGRYATPRIETELNRYHIPFRTIHLIDIKEPEQLDEDYLKMTAHR